MSREENLRPKKYKKLNRASVMKNCVVLLLITLLSESG